MCVCVCACVCVLCTGLVISIPTWSGKWVVGMDDYQDGVVGAKSKNLAGLRGKLPDNINLPSSVTLPFGCYEQVRGMWHATSRCVFLATVCFVGCDYGCFVLVSTQSRLCCVLTRTIMLWSLICAVDSAVSLTVCLFCDLG